MCLPSPCRATTRHWCLLAITTMGGTAEVRGSDPLESIVLNYDDIGSFSWADLPQPSQPTVRHPLLLQTGNAISWPVALGMELVAGDDLQNTAVWNIDAAFLPAATPTSEPALQFECFVAQEYGEGPVFRMYLKGNEAHTTRTIVLLAISLERP